jgi:hypothetical protein
MPTISRKRALKEWEQLLALLEENASKLPGIEADRETLQRLYLRARLAKDLCDAFAEARASAIHKLTVALAGGEATAAYLRGVIREKLGITACQIQLRLRRRPPIDG